MAYSGGGGIYTRGVVEWEIYYYSKSPEKKDVVVVVE
jgi:hypothetical protein